MEHAEDCQCTTCKPVVEKSKLSILKKVKPAPSQIEVEEEIVTENEQYEFQPQVSMPPRKVKNIAELNEKLEYYINKLRFEIRNQPQSEQRQQNQKVQKPKKPWYKSIGMWFVLLLGLAMVYGIYLFWMAEQGKKIVLPHL